MPNLYTIGYGPRPLAGFLDILDRYGIDFLVDIRSKPFSKFKPEFSLTPLQAHLKTTRFKYLFMGDVLGGLPDDPTVYTDGRVDYAKCRDTAWFQAGLARLQKADAQNLKLALMCAESRPEDCHRTKLLGGALADLGIELVHIDEHDELLTQEAALQKLTGGQLALFADPALRSRKRYLPED